jgi:membrane-associated phospholipid phosphatase
MPFSLLFDPTLWDSYKPGIWQQDIFTIPIEAGVLAMSSEYYTRAPEPLWPFRNERNNAITEPTRHEKTSLAIAGSVVGVGAFTLLAWSNPDFPIWNVAAGLIHTHLFVEIATGFAKRTWQRHRPFYDRKMRESGGVVEQDGHSFFSGHASHTMAYSVYLSHVLFTYANNTGISWGGAGLLVGGAAWVGAVRAIDGQHHPLDVVVGAAVGTVISSTVFWQMQDAHENQSKISGSLGSRLSIGATNWTSWRLGPSNSESSDKAVGATSGTTSFASENVSGLGVRYMLD